MLIPSMRVKTTIRTWRLMAGVCCFSGIMSWGSPALCQPSAILAVHAGDHDRESVPLSVRLPLQFEAASSVYLQRLDTAEEVSVQRNSRVRNEITWILQGRLARGQSRRYRVIASEALRRTPETATVRDTGKTLELRVSGRSALTYHTATVMPPRELDPVFQRSGFIHPLLTPEGRVLTADFPADHPHQHGIFFAWKEAEFEGQPVDFWNQAAKTGTVEHVSVVETQSGPVFAEFVTNLQHVALGNRQQRLSVLDEEWLVRLYALRDVFVFDLVSRQSCASSHPLKLLEYHYGGMGYRGPVEWLDPSSGFRMQTSEGLDRLAGNHSRARWVECTGGRSGQPCGLRIVQHPDNFRYPQPVRLHPRKPYFVFAPEVLGEFAIEPGDVYESTYRYISFDGPPTDAVEQLSNAFTSPPEIEIVR